MKATNFTTQSIILYFGAKPPLLRYGLAVLTVAIAAIATHIIPVFGGRAAFLLFFFAIIQTSFWLGRNPGLFAMTLSLFAVNALFLVTAWISAPHDALILNAGFCFLSVVMIATTSFHRQLVKVAATVPGLICSFRLRPDGSACMPYASPVIDSIYGLSLDVLSEDFSPVFARIHPDDIGHIHETIAESARSLQPWQDSFRYNHPTKGEIWIEGHSMPLREMDGCILWHGYIQDVTDRKHAETALCERETELRLIMDPNTALIAYLDTDFRYLRINKTYENWFCIPQERILGQDVREIIGERAWRLVRTYLERARGGERVRFDQKIPYGTGKPRWVHASYIPDKDLSGNVKGIVVHIFDINTSKKRTEEALRRARKKIRFFDPHPWVSATPMTCRLPYSVGQPGF